MILNKKHLEHLAKLARLELKAHEEEKLLKDLEKILEHFRELEELNTKNVAPMAGGTDFKNVMRPDEVREDRLRRDEAITAFPEQEGGYLKVPPVFEE